MSAGKMICFQRQDFSGLFYYGYRILNCWLIDYKQIPNLVCAFCVFFFFITARPGKNRLINWLAGGTFAIYIVHQVPPMESCLWNEILRCGDWSNDRLLIPRSILLLFTIMFVVTVIDHVRVRTAERWFMKLSLIRSAEKRIERLYGHVFENQ